MTSSTSGTCSTWRGRRSAKRRTSHARRTTPTRTLRLALIHLIQTIGEAARQVSREFCNDHPNVRWADIIGMRHKVVHDYLGIDDDIVWQVATEELPKLVTSLEALGLQ